MCETAFDGNKVLVCQVGDLLPGQQYRTPEGRTLMVLTLQADHDGYTRVADIVDGTVMNPSNSTKLGRDRAGRLYASRYLNKPVTQPVPTALEQACDALGIDRPVVLPDRDPTPPTEFPPDDATGFNNRHED